MEEERIGAERLESMTDAEVSGLFADGRSKRGEEYLDPDYARVCDQLARVPKMTLALQWARYLDCNPCGKRLYQYSQFCKKVGDYARTHDLVARIAHEPGRTMLVDWAGLAASVFDPVTGRRSPAYLFVASFPWSAWVYAECFPDMRTRSWIQAHVHAFRAAGGIPDILVPDNCATRHGPPSQVGAGEGQRRLPRDGRALRLRGGPGARAQAEGQGVCGEGRRPVRDVGARPAGRGEVHVLR